MFGPLLSVEMSQNCMPLVAKCTFESQNVKKTVVLGAFFDVLLWKNCLVLWRNAHVQVKMFHNCGLRSTVAKRTCASENVPQLWSAEHFSTF